MTEDVDGRQLGRMLERWVTEGLISTDQAERIRRREQARTPAAADAVPLVTEAMAYLGGVLILVAAALLTARYWDDLPLAGRLALAGVATLLLLAAGPAVPDRLGDAGRRVSAVLWLLSAAAFAGLLAIFGRDVLDLAPGEDVALLAGAGTAVYASVLWSRRRTGLQQVGVFLALVVTAAAAAVTLDVSETAPGLAVWALSLAWLALAWQGRLAPQRTAYALGSAGTVFGGLSTGGEDWGQVLAVASAVGLVVVAVLLGDLVVLAIGAVGTLLILPGAMATFFPGALAAPLGLLAAGVLLVAAALRTARRRRTLDEGELPRDEHLTPHESDR